MTKATLAVAGLMALCAQAVSADTISVPDPGNGIATLADALAVAQSGDDIVIAAGTYEESNTITIPGLRIRGVGRVILDGLRQQPVRPASPALRFDGIDGLELENLEIYGGRGVGTQNSSSTFLPGDAAPAIIATDSVFTASGCKIGALGSGGEDGMELTGCEAEFGNCTVTATDGAVGYSSQQNGYIGPAEEGGCAVLLDGGSLTATGSTFIAGTGSRSTISSGIGSGADGANGGAGIRGIGACTVTLTGCTLNGGDGGEASGFTAPLITADPGNGGCGVEMLGTGSLTSRSTTYQGGAGGIAQFGADGTAGGGSCLGDVVAFFGGDWLAVR